jgi:hypothetical protein
MQVAFRARSLARLNTGSNNPDRIAMMAMTTSNSINVKALDPGCWASGSVRPGICIFIWTADMANAHAACRVAQLYADAHAGNDQPVLPDSATVILVTRMTMQIRRIH